MANIDARGLVCPMPAALTLKAIKSGEPKEIVVLADDPCALENITRLAETSGYRVSSTKDGDEYTITLKK
ncbi:MAG: sulfurtransferase TusA family protein [Clostridia bacterium]|nr:sulfurtransferase TusA family protein [Clostridia bacterium]